MKSKVETESYMNYLKLNKTVYLFRNWIKHKNILINKPCDEKSHTIYAIAKLVNTENPLSNMMPQVHFQEDYCSTDYESWESLYLKDDLFISLENFHNNHHRAFSLETVFLSNKHNGFLRTELRYDDPQLTPMSKQDQKRFLAQLKERYPAYYKEYLNVQPAKDESSLLNINPEKLNRILNAVEVMLILSCHKGGLRNTSLPDSVTDFLSAYGYEILIQTLSESLSTHEREGLKSLWAKNIRTTSQKTVADLIDSALNGACTTTLGLYWLGLIKDFRKNFSVVLNVSFLTKIYDNFIENNSMESAKISKTFFLACIQENIRYIATEMINPVDEHDHANNRFF